MRGVTHASVGVASALVFLPVSIYGLSLAFLGSLLPDIDEPNSLISRYTFLGNPVVRFFAGGALAVAGFYYPVLLLPGLFLLILSFVPHRGVTHSLLCWLLTGAMAWLVVPEYVVYFMLGYLLHLLADLITGGVPLFWPKKERVSLFLGRTGGTVDYITLAVSALVVVWQIINFI